MRVNAPKSVASFLELRKVFASFDFSASDNLGVEKVRVTQVCCKSRFFYAYNCGRIEGCARSVVEVWAFVQKVAYSY